MTVTLELSPDIETKLHNELVRQDIPVEDYILRLVIDSVSEAEVAERHRKVAQWNQILEMGSDAEQKETFEILKKALDEDPL